MLGKSEPGIRAKLQASGRSRTWPGAKGAGRCWLVIRKRAEGAVLVLLAVGLVRAWSDLKELTKLWMRRGGTTGMLG